MGQEAQVLTLHKTEAHPHQDFVDLREGDAQVLEAEGLLMLVMVALLALLAPPA
jgi:hypothetical protein